MYCDATFNYVGAMSYEPVVQPVLDAREADLDFEECGFTRFDFESRVDDWTDAAGVDRVHGPEFHQVALDFTGADHAVVYPCIVRSPASAREVGDYAPITTVHSDFTEDYGRMVTDPRRPYRAFLEPALRHHGLDYDDVRSADRLMMLQLWRNTGPVEADHPLALCDARSVPVERLGRTVIPEYGGQRLEFEAFFAQPPPPGTPDHWYTYPRLESHEVVALRTYDSECVDAGRPFWTLHSAFRDPSVPDGPEHRRESVEMRALCIWES